MLQGTLAVSALLVLILTFGLVGRSAVLVTRILGLIELLQAYLSTLSGSRYRGASALDGIC